MKQKFVVAGASGLVGSAVSNGSVYEQSFPICARLRFFAEL